uniref:Uncharacterized protein n=1 Tax=Pithovirus LCPAC401 TaxID=2506595 RepID=A0A481ZD89_9VIRU|nr:MAG: uncharacterized protein LCPAC401_02790 [Pithovirus LCPAC401]
MAHLIDSRELVKYRAVKESLLSKGYNDRISNRFAELICKMDNRIVTRFCVHTHVETNMGHCSHWFASKLREISKDWSKLSVVITARDIFPEISRNVDANNRRKKRSSWTKPVLDMMDLELMAMENAFEEAIHSDEDKPIITSKDSHYARAFTDLCEDTFINWYLQKHVLSLKDGKICKIDRDEMILSLANGKYKNDAMMRILKREVLILKNYWVITV